MKVKLRLAALSLAILLTVAGALTAACGHLCGVRMDVVCFSSAYV